MNKKFVIVEPPHFIVDTISSIALSEGDEFYIISNEERYSGLNNACICDVRSEFNKAINFISEKVKNPTAIVTIAEMFLTQVDMLVKEFGLCRNNDETASITRDKSRMKTVWNEKGIATPYSRFFKSSSELKQSIDSLSYPCIIKPSLGYTSCGVKKVENEIELFEQLGKIFKLNATTLAREGLKDIGFLVEEFIDGNEYSVDTIWFDGVPLCSGVLSREVAPGPYYPDRLYYIDPALDKELENKLLDISYRVAESAGVKFGATHTEIRVKNGEPYIIETTSRPGAGAIFYYLFEKAYEISFYNIYYHVHMCSTYSEIERYLSGIQNKKVTNYYYYYYNLPYESEGIIDQILGVDVINSRPEVLRTISFKKPGNILYKEDMSPDYFFWILGGIPIEHGCNLSEYVKQYDNMMDVIFVK